MLKVPGIVFARGPAVTVLILLESEGMTYAVLTEQVEKCFSIIVLLSSLSIKYDKTIEQRRDQLLKLAI